LKTSTVCCNWTR